MTKRALGANYWKDLAGRGRRGLTDEFRASLVCPDDDAPLDYLETTQSFRCPACARAFEDRDGILSIMPSADQYRLRADQLEALALEAADCAADTRTATERHPTLMPLVERACGALEGKRVLDLCCGTGWAAAWFAERGARVAALDAVAGPGGLETARTASERVDCFQGDVCRLPFAPDAFHVVFLSDAVNRMARPERLAREAARVLRPDGILIDMAEPMGRGTALGVGDPRGRGRMLAWDDYRAILAEGGLESRPVYTDGTGLAPAAGLWQRIAARRRESADGGERLLVARHRVGISLSALPRPWKRKGNDHA